MNAFKRIMTSVGQRESASLPALACSSWPRRHRGIFPFRQRVSTDDAQVDAHIAPIRAKVGGDIARDPVETTRSSRPGRCCCESIRGTTRRGLTRRARSSRLPKPGARRGCRRAADGRDNGGRRRPPARSWQRRPPIMRSHRRLRPRVIFQSRRRPPMWVDVRRPGAPHADLERMAPLAAKKGISKRQFGMRSGAARRDQRAAASEQKPPRPETGGRQQNHDGGVAGSDRGRSRRRRRRPRIAGGWTSAGAGQRVGGDPAGARGGTAARLQLSYDGDGAHRRHRDESPFSSGNHSARTVVDDDCAAVGRMGNSQLQGNATRGRSSDQRAEIHVDTCGRVRRPWTRLPPRPARSSACCAENAGKLREDRSAHSVKIALDRTPAGYTFRPGMNVDVTIFTK